MLICILTKNVVFLSSRRRHSICSRDWSSDVCSSDLHGLAPVFAIAISAALLARDLLPVLHEARALPARDNLLVQHTKRRGRLRHWLHLRGASSYGSIRSGEWIRQTSSRKNVIRTSPFRFFAPGPKRRA